MTAAIHETKREIVAADVGEVSLVDHPAIEEEWLVIKTLQTDTQKENPMANKEAAKAPAQAAPEVKPVEKAATTPEVIPEVIPEVAPEVAPEAAPAVVPEATREADVKKAQELFTQATLLLAPHQPPATPETEPAVETEPEVEVETAKALISIHDGKLVIDQHLLDVAKAKTFSQGRTNALITSVKALMDVLKDVAPEAIAGLLDTESETPATVAKSVATPAPNVSEAITAAVTKALAPVTERLVKLEGSKALPKSGDGDQTAEVKKSETSIWAGSALG